MKKYIVLIVMTNVMMYSINAVATNGLFAHGYGTASKGLAGGGVALPEDAMAVATNPAGMAFVGTRMDVGLSIFSPSPRGYTAGAPGQPVGNNPNDFPLIPQEVESSGDTFLIPQFAYNRAISSDHSFGISVYGNGGMNTDYSATDQTFRDGEAGIDLQQLFINLSFANRISQSTAIGASLILARQQFEAKGLGNFKGFSSAPDSLTDNGADAVIGKGFKIGLVSELSSAFNVGFSYQTEIDMEKFDKYKGLFAEQGKLNVPPTWTLGFAIKPTATSAIVFDVQEIKYSEVKAISNPFTDQALFGADGGPGFGWEDMRIYKVGYKWQMGNIIWRSGYSIADQPIPESQVIFNILAPAVIEEHYTFGFTYLISNTSEFNMAFMYAPKNSVEGQNTLYSGGQPITIEMSQYEIDLSWGSKF